jgi:hypothetical protein
MGQAFRSKWSGIPGEMGLKGGKSLSNSPEQVVAAAEVTLLMLQLIFVVLRGVEGGNKPSASQAAMRAPHELGSCFAPFNLKLRSLGVLFGPGGRVSQQPFKVFVILVVRHPLSLDPLPQSRDIREPSHGSDVRLDLADSSRLLETRFYECRV